MKEELYVLIIRPGKNIEEKIIENKVSAFEEIIGAPYKALTMPFNFNMYYNEFATEKNLEMFSIPFNGTVIVTGSTVTGEPTSICDNEIAFIKRYVKQNCV